MIMDPDKKKFILLALIVFSAVIIGLIIYFLVYYSYADQTKNVSSLIEQAPMETPRIVNDQTTQSIDSVSPTQAPTIDLVQENALQVAKNFVERYGTYSNQGGQEQFSDLYLFVTDRMKTWLVSDNKNLLASLKHYETSYVVVTKAVSVRALSADSSGVQIKVVVNTRRSEQSGDEAPNIAYKDIQVSLIKIGKRWRVDEAVWQ